ncbi:MAG: DUF3347 domain-containing protein [Bacteroidota bacterium]
MKRVIILFIIALLAGCSSKEREAKNPVSAFDSVDPSTRSQIAGLLNDYFTLNQSLILDSLAGAKLAASKFSETAKNFNVEKLTPEQLDFYLVHSSDLKTSLAQLDKSNNIEEARVELAVISEAMYAMVKAFHPNDTPLYYQYCPMARDNKGANWLSATNEVVNPYMGQMMPSCGRTQETIE